MKTLVIYATTYGFTKECVEDLKKQIKGDILTVNVMSDKKPSLDEFDNIVIGGSIYMGHFQKKLRTFCTENLNMLLNKRLGLFLCCGLLENFEETLKRSFPEELLKKAVVKECFGGELRTDKMNFVHKMISGLMKKATEKEGKPEPVKIPENIRKFAEMINRNE